MRFAVLLTLIACAACASPDTSAPAEPAPDTAAVASPAPPAAPDLSSENVLVVVFFGNSLTAGYGLADPDVEAFPARIEEKAEAAGLPVRVVNAGVSGETSAGGLRRVDWVLDGDEPDVFVLELGANDGLRGLDPAAMQANLEGILEKVRAKHPEARLVVAGMEAPPNYGLDYTARFRAVFPAVARRFDAALIPFLLEGVGGVRSLNQGDRVHPTAEGHRRMAETAWRTLAPILRETAAERAS
ncbi:MAG TPA: arylesterase [Rubricoccaceae bacterium]|nr:arylesterase [Rubricoccaceae bacterium]